MQKYIGITILHISFGLMHHTTMANACTMVVRLQHAYVFGCSDSAPILVLGNIESGIETEPPRSCCTFALVAWPGLPTSLLLLLHTGCAL